MTPWQRFVKWFCRVFNIGGGVPPPEPPVPPSPEPPRFSRPYVHRTDPEEAARAERAVKALEDIARALSPRYWDDR